MQILNAREQYKLYRAFTIWVWPNDLHLFSLQIFEILADPHGVARVKKMVDNENNVTFFISTCHFKGLLSVD